MIIICNNDVPKFVVPACMDYDDVNTVIVELQSKAEAHRQKTNKGSYSGIYYHTIDVPVMSHKSCAALVQSYNDRNGV